MFDGREGLLLEVEPQSANWPRIHEGSEAFMRFIHDDQSPSLSDRDTLMRDDPEWEGGPQEGSDTSRPTPGISRPPPARVQPSTMTSVAS